MKRLSQSEVFEVMKLIEAHGKRIDDGRFEYEPGWSDERVASDLKVDAQSVAFRRREVFGKLYFRGANADKEELLARVTTLEVGSRTSRVSVFELTKRVEALEKAVNILLTGPSRVGVEQKKLDELKQHFNGMAPVTPRV